MNQAKKILILGSSPLPIEKEILYHNAAGLRTWQFIQGIKTKSKIDVYLLTPHQEINTKKNFSFKNFSFIYIDEKKATHWPLFNKKKLTQNYSVLIGINNNPSYAAALMNPPIPFWADLNGYLMAEAQSKANLEKNDNYLFSAWYKEKKILQIADKISTVTWRQKYITIGELAGLGRLNQLTNQYPFVEKINAPFFKPNPSDPMKPKIQLNPKNFNIFSIGGYNTWTDVRTLFYGLENAMKKNKNIKFISTGGTIGTHDNITFKKFLKLIQKSSFKENYIFLGWLKKEELPYYYQNCHLGILSDKNNYESQIGARNRTNEMIAFKLPTLISQITEVSDIIHKNNLGITYKVSNHKDLTEKIIYCTKNKDKIKAFADKAFQYFFKKYSSQKCLKNLNLWLKNPQKSPDHKKTLNLNKKTKIFFFELHLHLKKIFNENKK